MVPINLLRPQLWRAGASTCRLRGLQRPAASGRECLSWQEKRHSSTDADGIYQPFMGSGLSRILTDEQRMIFKQVNQLSSLSKSLARQVGNVPVKEDSLLADIARLQAQRRMRQQRDQQEKSTTQQHQSADEVINDDALPSSLFTVVFAGEFNSGKSTLINAMLGNDLLDTGVLPTTDMITIMMANHDDSEDESGASSLIESSSIGLDTGVAAHTQLHLLPKSKFPLSDLCFIDTPGTNAILSLQHTSSTLRILHDADLIVFVTSADRPFSQSEKDLLQTSIKSYRKRVVLVINKMDVLERQQGEDHGDTTKKRVEDYVVEHAGDLLGARPVVIPLSARDALSVKLLYKTRGTLDDNTLWKRSNFGTLEHFLSTTLTASSKVKTKLLNPIGVAEGILLECQNEIQQRHAELDVDIMTLRLLSQQTGAWEKEQREMIKTCQTRVGDIISERSQMAKRVVDELSVIELCKMGIGIGEDVFDRSWLNANRQASSKAYDANALNNETPLVTELLAISGECAGRLCKNSQNQGTASVEYLGKRPAVIGLGRKADSNGTGVGRMIGNVSAPKFERLKDLHSTVAAAIQNSTSNLPNDSQCRESVYSSLRRTSLLSSVLLGSGAIPAALSMFNLMDASAGIVASGALAGLGAVMLPLGNRIFAQSYEREWKDNTAQLASSIGATLDSTLDQIRSDLDESVAPYSRYVKTEGEWLKELTTKMDAGIANSHSLRSKINKVCQ
ncbi:hypothetical protein ACHAWF_018554 [Thalassiosira exigua]